MLVKAKEKQISFLFQELAALNSTLSFSTLSTSLEKVALSSVSFQSIWFPTLR